MELLRKPFLVGTVNDTPIHHEKTEQLSCSIYVEIADCHIFGKYGVSIDVGGAYSQVWGKYPQNRPGIWTANVGGTSIPTAHDHGSWSGFGLGQEERYLLD